MLEKGISHHSIASHQLSHSLYADRFNHHIEDSLVSLPRSSGEPWTWNKKAVLSQRLPRDAPYLYNKKIPK